MKDKIIKQIEKDLISSPHKNIYEPDGTFIFSADYKKLANKIYKKYIEKQNMKKVKNQVCVNTDREIYRQPTKKWTNEDGDDSGMEPYVFVTKSGGIGFNYYGTCVVKPIKDWIKNETIKGVK